MEEYMDEHGHDCMIMGEFDRLVFAWSLGAFITTHGIWNEGRGVEEPEEK